MVMRVCHHVLKAALMLPNVQRHENAVCRIEAIECAGLTHSFSHSKSRCALAFLAPPVLPQDTLHFDPECKTCLLRNKLGVPHPHPNPPGAPAPESGSSAAATNPLNYSQPVPPGLTTQQTGAGGIGGGAGNPAGGPQSANPFCQLGMGMGGFGMGGFQGWNQVLPPFLLLFFPLSRHALCL